MPRIISITVGQFSRFFARYLTRKYIQKVLLDITLAVIGALIGAWFFGFIDYSGPPGVTEVSERHMLINMIGSAALYIIFQALTQSTD